MTRSFLLTSILLFLTLSPSFSNTSEDQPQQSLRNLAFLGSTGNGKSATCNHLIGLGPDLPFKVGHRAIGETSQVVEYTAKAKGIRIIDTPGFGDNRFDEAHISSVIRQFTQAIVDPLDLTNPKVDAFILVVRLNPRASSLRSDIDHARDLFGSVVIKSLILLVIDSNYPGNKYSADDFLNDLKQMKEVVNVLKQNKKEEPNHNWFVMWDNKNPRPGQEKELFEKIEKLEPYTHKKFIEADKEIKQRISVHIKEELERETRRMKREFEDDYDELKYKLLEMQEKYEENLKKIVEERDKANSIAEKYLKPKEEGFSLKETVLAGAIGAKIGGPIGAIVGALAVNILPDNIPDEVGEYDINDEL